MNITWNHCSQQHGCDRMVAECSLCGGLVHKDNRDSHEDWHYRMEVSRLSGPFGPAIMKPDNE